MIYSKNIIIQYTLLIFFVVFFVSGILAILLSRSMTEKVIDQHIEIYPQLIENIIKTQPQINSFFLNHAKVSDAKKFTESLTNILNFSNIFRIKIWDLNNTILWSDQTDIIGKKFPKNSGVLLAMQGGVHHHIERPHKAEHLSEKESAVILEIYVPVKLGNDTIGIIELYEEADELFWSIQKNNSIIWMLIVLEGFVIYGLLIFIFFNAQRNQILSNKKLSRTQEVLISSLAHQAGIRDNETGSHLERTSTYVRLIAEELKKCAKHKKHLSNEYIDDMVKSSALHDIGKVGLADDILCKPGILMAEEFERMKKHCEYGANVLKKAIQKLEFDSFLTIAIPIALHHHERWDGKGYPDNLEGNEIPLPARIMALADVYDALRSKRCYKEAFTHYKSREIILDGNSTHFDPDIVEAFIRAESEFEKISTEMAD
jgi:response regulator RpfG family c-di-GMP phosphodiesterase